MFPVISVAGTARERGEAYGVQARERVHRCIEVYDETFAYSAAWDWARARSAAEQFAEPIARFDSSYLDELAGIAHGAGVELEDILAINVRTEILFSNLMAGAAPSGPDECSAFACARDDAPIVVGQNWDWAPSAADTCVVLQAEPDDAPAFTTVVEAGLLAKFGVNADGLAVMTNALGCSEDVAAPGVPYHVVLRALLGCGSTKEAVERLESAGRSSSANYLIVDSTGEAVDIETRPGGPEALHRLVPDRRGVLLHTNHFVADDFPAVDYTTLVDSTTRTRLGRLSDVVADAAEPSDLAMFEQAMTDHTNAPDSVCRHPDTQLPLPDQSMTVSSALVNLTTRTWAVSEGPPCERGYEDVAWPGSTAVVASRDA